MILSPTKFHLPNTSQRIFRKSFVLRLVVHVGKEIHIPETDLFSRNLVYNNTVCRRVQNYSWMQYWLLPFFKNVYPTSMPSETLVNPLFLNQSTFSASSVWFLNSSHSLRTLRTSSPCMAQHNPNTDQASFTGLQSAEPQI